MRPVSAVLAGTFESSKDQAQGQLLYCEDHQYLAVASAKFEHTAITNEPVPGLNPRPLFRYPYDAIHLTSHMNPKVANDSELARLAGSSSHILQLENSLEDLSDDL